MRESACLWFNGYLRNPNKRTYVQGEVSGLVKKALGVPQGSVRGPLLLNIMHVNDVLDILRNLFNNLSANNPLVLLHTA